MSFPFRWTTVQWSEAMPVNNFCGCSVKAKLDRKESLKRCAHLFLSLAFSPQSWLLFLSGKHRLRSDPLQQPLLLVPRLQPQCPRRSSKSVQIEWSGDLGDRKFWYDGKTATIYDSDTPFYGADTAPAVIGT